MTTPRSQSILPRIRDQVLERRATGPAAAVERLDQRAFSRLSTIEHGPLRPALKGTAIAGKAFLPWLAMTGGLLLYHRRDVVPTVTRAWAAVAVTAVIQRGLKGATKRVRPRASQLPRRQRRRSEPATSAFPSGHAATTTAFAVALGPDNPALEAASLGAALLATYSFVYTGHHYLSDAVAGVAIGAAVGASVRALATTTRQVPAPQDGCDQAEATVDSGALRDGGRRARCDRGVPERDRIQAALQGTH